MLKIKKLLLAILLIPLISISNSNAETVNPTINPANLREKIRADMDIKMQNVRANQEARNQIIEKTRPSYTAPINNPYERIENSAERKIGNQIEQKMERRLSSSSPQFREGIAVDKIKIMTGKVLTEKKETVSKQLDVAIKNLEELRKRIGSRTEKDRMTNKDMGMVIELLKIADKKIALAKEALAKLRAYEPITKDAATTTPINLDQIRGIIDNAHKSIKEAHRALTDVVVAIAKISGVNKERISTSTPARIFAPTTSPISTTAPSPVTSIPPSTN